MHSIPTAAVVATRCQYRGFISREGGLLLEGVFPPCERTDISENLTFTYGRPTANEVAER